MTTHRLLNSYEEVTYQRLKEAVDQNGAHVFAKVRLADAIPLNRSGVSDADFTFALKAHVDFVIADHDYSPIFAVEFDGPSHTADVQKHRDEQKDSLTAQFNLPLLRINANYLNRKYRDFDLLTYIVEVWFLHNAFLEAQKAGYIPHDEPFDPASVISDNRGRKSWPYWLSLEAQTKIGKLYQAGRVASDVPSYWVGLDDAKRYRCVMWMHLPKKGCCFVETGMRSQRFPLCESDMLVQIATFDIFDQLNEILSGEQQARSVEDLTRRYDYYTRHFQWMGNGGTSRTDGSPLT